MDIRIGSFRVNTLDYFGDRGWVVIGYHEGLKQMKTVQATSADQSFSSFMDQLVELFGEKREA